MDPNVKAQCDTLSTDLYYPMIVFHYSISGKTVPLPGFLWQKPVGFICLSRISIWAVYRLNVKYDHLCK